VEPREIGFVNALIEGHDGIATMRTLDRTRGLVMFWLPAGQWADFDAMFDALQSEVSIVRVANDDPILEGLPVREWEGD
jgi:hypothetical protein